MKNMTQAWGWLMAGVLAAGLNASYHSGGLQWAHEIADQVQHNTAAVLALASGNATQFLSEAQAVTARNEKSSCPLAHSLARVQAKVASSEQARDEFEIISDQEEAQLDRLEANRDRIEAQVQAQVAAQTAHLRVASMAFAPVAVKAMPAVVCPRVRVNIPRMPAMKMPVVPEVHINLPSAGPV
jgi:hypothetical protein